MPTAGIIDGRKFIYLSLNSNNGAIATSWVDEDETENHFSFEMLYYGPSVGFDARILLGNQSNQPSSRHINSISSQSFQIDINFVKENCVV